MPPLSSPRDRGETRAAAVRQVLIARTREALCAACTEAPGIGARSAVSMRVEGTELFVITPDVVLPGPISPADTIVVRLDGGLASPAWSRRAVPSSETSAHAALHRDGARAVASGAGRIVPSTTPVLALTALAERVGDASSPTAGPHPGSGNPLPAPDGKTR